MLAEHLRAAAERHALLAGPNAATAEAMAGSLLRPLIASAVIRSAGLTSQEAPLRALLSVLLPGYGLASTLWCLLPG